MSWRSQLVVLVIWYGGSSWEPRAEPGVCWGLLWGGHPAGTGTGLPGGAPGPTSHPADGLLWVLSPQGAGRVLRE